jgi:hypothetical protein
MLGKLFGLKTCDGTWSVIVQIVLLATLFLLFSATWTYRQTNKLTNMNDKGIETLSDDNVPTAFGYTLHTILFASIVTLLLCWGDKR